MALKLKTIKISNSNCDLKTNKDFKYLIVEDGIGLLNAKVRNPDYLKMVKAGKRSVRRDYLTYITFYENGGCIPCGICGATAKYAKYFFKEKLVYFYNLNDGLEDVFNIDHIVPTSVGGANNMNNLQITCKSCNKSKENTIIKEYQKIAFTGMFGFINFI